MTVVEKAIADVLSSSTGDPKVVVESALRAVAKYAEEVGNLNQWWFHDTADKVFKSTKCQHCHKPLTEYEISFACSCCVSCGEERAP